jgi:hypothetical protein
MSPALLSRIVKRSGGDVLIVRRTADVDPAFVAMRGLAPECGSVKKGGRKE